jgi:hypothetical protein
MQPDVSMQPAVDASASAFNTLKFQLRLLMHMVQAAAYLPVIGCSIIPGLSQDLVRAILMRP